MNTLRAATLLSFSLVFIAAGAQAQEGTPKATVTPVLYEANADASAQIDAALKKATKENRRVLIQWGANWCGWCHKLADRFKNSPKIARVLRYDYDVVHVDVGRFDKNLDLGEKYGTQWKKDGIPYLTILSADGKVLVNQETGSLESGSKHDPAKVLAFLEKYKAPPRNAESTLASALAEATKENKTVFLHFGAPWCGWCHRFEAWLAEKDVAKIMAEHFVEVKVDTDRDLGGAELMTRYAESRSRGIPWFVVLSGDGTVVTTSDGPDGNVGCPWTDEEVKTFGIILDRSKSGFTPAQITQLKESLVAMRERSEKK